MIPHKMKAKLFLTDETAVSPAALIPVFHKWVQTHALSGLLIDVADYKHVQDGPGVLIIGHEGDYALDQANGRDGFLYTRKRAWPAADFRARLELVIRLAVQGAQLLAAETTLAVGFRTDEIELTFPDRLNTPNNPETLAALRPDITAVLAGLYGTGDITLQPLSSDPKRPFALQAVIPHAPTLPELAARQQEVNLP